MYDLSKLTPFEKESVNVAIELLVEFKQCDQLSASDRGRLIDIMGSFTKELQIECYIAANTILILIDPTYRFKRPSIIDRKGQVVEYVDIK